MDSKVAGLGAPARLRARFRDSTAGWFVSERARWALWIPVAFGVGIGVYFALPAEPALAIGPAEWAEETAQASLRTRRHLDDDALGRVER